MRIYVRYVGTVSCWHWWVRRETSSVQSLETGVPSQGLWGCAQSAWLVRKFTFFGYSTKADISTQYRSPQFPILLSSHICKQDTVTTATLRRLRLYKSSIIKPKAFRLKTLCKKKKTWKIKLPAWNYSMFFFSLQCKTDKSIKITYYTYLIPPLIH